MRAADGGSAGDRERVASRFLDRLRSETPSVGVELRPPRADLARGSAMDTWIDLSHSIRRVVARDAFLMLTDNAVGQREEENLQHLTTNVVGEVDPWRVIPFLTTKHPLDYCLRYGDRARLRGLDALTVVGGDPGGAPRCVPHAYELRRLLRERVPDMALGGWVNPHRPTDEQIRFVSDDGFEADYYLTQVISHHDIGRAEAWLRALDDAGIDLPGAFGIFYYRNGRREALERLSRFFPVPVDAVARAFESGVDPIEHCGRTIRALRDVGARHVYVCNLGAAGAGSSFPRIMDGLGSE
ncbi:MAG: hypothetical protein MJB57_17680 [Gemmatimonadetes bacterium]|nr:hypothetical protein [Gemmatimonadota bacterium]